MLSGIILLINVLISKIEMKTDLVLIKNVLFVLNE